MRKLTRDEINSLSLIEAREYLIKAMDELESSENSKELFRMQGQHFQEECHYLKSKFDLIESCVEEVNRKNYHQTLAIVYVNQFDVNVFIDSDIYSITLFGTPDDAVENYHIVDELGKIFDKFTEFHKLDKIDKVDIISDSDQSALVHIIMSRLGIFTEQKGKGLDSNFWAVNM